MYELLKKFIPKRFALANEDSIRKFIHAFFYKGNKFQCVVCGALLSRFIRLNNAELLCPSCGSLGRNRRLWSQLISHEYSLQNCSILHFSPSRSLYKKFRELPEINYVSSDFNGHFAADYNMDITNLKFSNDSFDYIICYHILEHVEDDIKAMSELHRVLKKGGKCFIQTPFKEGEIYENINIVLPSERKKHFGQEDHVRVYSLNGLSNRLQKAGFKTEIRQFTEQADNYYGFSCAENILTGMK